MKTTKGGAGKTETAECVEAATTLGEGTCALIDVDDGNRGIARRVGADNVIKIEWDTPVTTAPDWLARHGPSSDTMIFDLGAGIDSSDLPVMSFLASVWRLLADGGARIILCAVVSTNAPTSAFIGRMDRRSGGLGEIVIVCNNQDGSEEYPAEIEGLAQRKIALGQLQAGIQAVRLSRRERLSAVIRNPSAGYSLATALMARRIYNFAKQSFFQDLFGEDVLDRLRPYSELAPTNLQYTVGTRAAATDEVIQQNVLVTKAELALRRAHLTDDDILVRAHDYRREHDAFMKLLRQPKVVG